MRWRPVTPPGISAWSVSHPYKGETSICWMVPISWWMRCWNPQRSLWDNPNPPVATLLASALLVYLLCGLKCWVSWGWLLPRFPWDLLISASTMLHRKENNSKSLSLDMLKLQMVRVQICRPVITLLPLAEVQKISSIFLKTIPIA